MSRERPPALLVVNPTATTTRVELRDLITAALAGTVDLEVAATRGRGHATELAAEARDRGVRTVIVLGGDGTANEAIQALAGTDVALGLVPGGGANVLARALGLPTEPVAATSSLLGALRGDRRRRIGLGRADERLFGFNAGLGLDAGVVRRVERDPARKQLLRQLAYVTSAASEWRSGGHAQGTVRVRTTDGEEHGPFAVALVANTTPYTALGDRPLTVHPDASFDLGLDLLTVAPTSFARLALVVAGALAAGRHLGLPEVTLHHDLAELTLVSDRPLPVHVDGDPLPARRELHLTTEPAALDVLA